jgi:hypothetical protein
MERVWLLFLEYKQVLADGPGGFGKRLRVEREVQIHVVQEPLPPNKDLGVEDSKVPGMPLAVSAF